jgi:hypothetical protein
MKLFLYDGKHEQVIDELELETKEIETVEKVIKFLNKNYLTNRYEQLLIAEKYTTVMNELEEFEEIVFK